jgi:hypothetical protein
MQLLARRFFQLAEGSFANWQQVAETFREKPPITITFTITDQLNKLQKNCRQRTF